MSDIHVNNASVNNASILLVEDDDVTAYMLTYLLKREGYDVTCLSDGQQAYDLIKQGNAYALALLDVMIPYRNGIELISQIRSLPSWDNTPVIMISGKSQEQDIIKALDAGANDYVTKPFQPGEVLARIRNSVAARQ